MPGTRGKRDPDVAARIQARRPAQSEDAPASIALPDVPLAELVDDDLNDAGQYNPEDLPMLFPGDVVLAKVVHTVEIDGMESWFTYGIQSRVQPDESEEEAFNRVCTVANSRVIELIADAQERIDEETQRRAEIAEAERADRERRQAAAGVQPAGSGRIQPRRRKA